MHEHFLELARLNRWLKDDGMLVLSLSHAVSFEFRWFKDVWYALQLPTHLLSYKLESIEMILKKRGFYENPAEYTAIYGGDECGSGVWGCDPHSCFLDAPLFKVGSFTSKNGEL